MTNSAVFGFCEDEETLIVRGYKNADVFNDKISSLDTGLSALVGLTVYNKVDKISYCDYYFRKKQDERIVMASDQGKAHNDSIYIPFNGFANNRFLIMQFDGKKIILNSKKIVKDIPDGILKEVYNRYNDNPQWIDQSSLLDVHKEVLRQNFLLIS